MKLISKKIECFCCPEKRANNLLVHHKGYGYDSIRSKYYDTRNLLGSIAYHKDLEYEIKKYPDRFVILCNYHHKLIHYLLNQSPRWVFSYFKNNDLWNKFFVKSLYVDNMLYLNDYATYCEKCDELFTFHSCGQNPFQNIDVLLNEVELPIDGIFGNHIDETKYVENKIDSIEEFLCDCDCSTCMA